MLNLVPKHHLLYSWTCVVVVVVIIIIIIIIISAAAVAAVRWVVQQLLILKMKSERTLPILVRVICIHVALMPLEML